jgi:hypothetical protein
MTRDEFLAMLEDDHKRIVGINQTKGHDYAGRRRRARELQGARKGPRRDQDPVFQAWFIYFGKHWQAVLTFLKEGDVKSEPIDGRIDDAILYLHLLRGLIHEKHAAATAAVEMSAATAFTQDHSR